MILIIDICSFSFHRFEFVKPVEDILQQNDIAFKTAGFKEIDEDLLDSASGVIICGTGLLDEEYGEDMEYFGWLREYARPVLGICGGFELLCLIFGDGVLVSAREIGLKRIVFAEEFLGLVGETEVYELHRFSAVVPKCFRVVSSSEICAQAIVHVSRPLMGVMFHPEVRNKECISLFARSVDE